MGPFEMMVAVVGMGCFTGIAVTFLNTIRAAAERRPSRQTDALLHQLAELQAEVRQLRQENSSRVLNLDTTLEQLDRRISRTESRIESRAQSAETEYQRVGR